jgi:hypothetical protein
MLSKRIEEALACQRDILHCQDRQGQLIAKMTPMLHQQELWNRVHAVSSAVGAIQQHLATWGADSQYADRRWLH